MLKMYLLERFWCGPSAMEGVAEQSRASRAEDQRGHILLDITSFDYIEL